uniref:Ribosomal RNA methyltransferase FtsJ domain-containing protein n=1 Tax=Ditylum brightwellii TaxID=49249 RepID=A0A6V2D7D3_9STRA
MGIELESSKLSDSNNNNDATDTNNNDEGEKEKVPLYQEIKAVVTTPPQKHTKSSQRKTAAKSDFNTKHQIATSSTTLLNVQKSHAYRVISFLESYKIKVTGHYVCGSVAIVGVQEEEEDEVRSFLRGLEDTIPIFHRAIQKMYHVNPAQMVVEELEEEETAYQKVIQLLQKLTKSTTTTPRVRFNTFPPSKAQELILYLEHNFPQLSHLLAPTSCTHILNVVKIPTTLRNSNLWCIGMNQVTTADPSQNMKTKDLICRAQSKLQEAFARYNYALPDAATTSQNRLVAVDCGAAPGGWTQFLATKVQCKKIYSIDPGELDPIVFNTHYGDERVVQHLRQKVEYAMDEILQLEVVEEGNNRKSPMVDIWVSDMCLYQMSQQVDLMLQAREVGIVGEGTFFVLTLKCTIGHSRKTFDEQVATQCDRLLSLGSGGAVRDLQTIHLFSNRGGERTILGYLT